MRGEFAHDRVGDIGLLCADRRQFMIAIISSCKKTKEEPRLLF